MEADNENSKNEFNKILPRQLAQISRAEFQKYQTDQKHYIIGEIELKDSKRYKTEEIPLLMKHIFNHLSIDQKHVRGKVLEYLYRLRPAHFEALLKCGHIKKKGL
jgi:hypothetical protein